MNLVIWATLKAWGGLAALLACSTVLCGGAGVLCSVLVSCLQKIVAIISNVIIVIMILVRNGWVGGCGWL